MRVALFVLCLAASALHAGAATLRWSSQGDFLTADPHAQNEGINNLINFHFYERLTTRSKKLEIVPSLATSWEQLDARTWRFHLRKGVRFHDGTPFTADDVVFSVERAQLPNSNFKVFANPIGKARRVDDFTVEFATPSPDPLLLEQVNTIAIMSRAWCAKHHAEVPQDYKSAEETFAARNANGTGPYKLVSREADVATKLAANPDWWGIGEGRFEGNATEVVYRPIRSDATRMAALLSGELDFVLDPPLQDIPRLKRERSIRVIEGAENRVIFLVMDQGRQELKYSGVKGRNPFRDERVRRALYAAIDEEAIRSQVMRGQAQPTGSMIPAAFRSDPSLEPRLLPFDPAQARRLLAEAGYPQGFDVTLDCPNNRYVNDERICTALAAMFARVGIRTRVNAMPRAQFFQKVDLLDFSLHLYGWGGAATDPGLTLGPVLHSYDGKGLGDFNSGRFSDPDLDRLIDAANVEMDATKRSAMLLEAMARVRSHVYVLPLHRQMIPWAARANVGVVHRPDNFLEALWVKIE